MKAKQVKLSEVKGRPRLHWIGKKSVDVQENFPAQLVESFHGSKATKVAEVQDDLRYDQLKHNWHNLLFHGDNKEVLVCLLQHGFRGKIDLIYIDPPFDSKADYIRTVNLRGTAATAEKKLSGEEQSILEQKQYFDIWKNDDYLQFMYERLILMKELLSDRGSLYLHCDWHKSHHLRCLLDEVFGEDNFRNEIVWNYRGTTNSPNYFARKHDVIYSYSKKEPAYFNADAVRIPYEDNGKFKQDTSGQWYQKWDKDKDYYPRQTQLDNGEFHILGKYQYDVWNDIPSMATAHGNNKYNYPTQKPNALLERIIQASSNEDSIILDCFCGSGTTQRVAQQLGRRWIGSDINKGAVQLTSKEIQKIVAQQQAKTRLGAKAPRASFLHYRVNNYDLQIMHTEAIDLAVKKLGIEKTQANFFYGELNGKLVRIIDITRPLSPVDIQDVQDELASLSNEARNISIVCCGQQEDTKPIIAAHNQRSPINKLEVIDLKEEKFMLHQPCQAEVKLEGDRLTIKNFVSPTIIKRLNQDAGLAPTEIEDFCTMIDCVLIDNDYDGKVFNIASSAMPAKKDEFVKGTYTIEPVGKLAVKIIDMLGEELLIEL